MLANFQICISVPLKSSLHFKKDTTLLANDSRILRIRNAKFSGYIFYMKRNIWRDFEICSSVPLRSVLIWREAEIRRNKRRSEISDKARPS